MRDIIGALKMEPADVPYPELKPSGRGNMKDPNCNAMQIPDLSTFRRRRHHRHVVTKDDQRTMQQLLV